MKEKKLKVAIIREELVELTGDAISALVLNQAIYHHHAIEEMDNSTMEFIEKLEKQGANELAEQARKNLRDGWFYKSPNSFFKEIMISSRSTVMRRLNELVKMGYMIKGGQNIGFANVDDTWWKVNIPKIRKDLAKLGYTLNGYPMWEDVECPKIKEEKSEGVHGEQGTNVSGVHGERGGVHGERGGVHGEQHLKTTTKKDYKDISSSREQSTKLNLKIIDSELKAKYPDPPFEEVKEAIITDETLTIETAKQYKAILEYRLKNWKPKKAKSPTFRKSIRKEIVPEFMKPGYKSNYKSNDDETVDEELKRSVEERLKKYQNK